MYSKLYLHKKLIILPFFFLVLHYEFTLFCCVLINDNLFKDARHAYSELNTHFTHFGIFGGTKTEMVLMSK